MNWLERLARNAGLMIHHAVKPVGKQTHRVGKTVEEKKLDETTTLRRTTIDEIEIKRNA